MSIKSTRTVLLFSLTVFLYILIGGVVDGIRLGKPQELDSITYHIPIAKQFLKNWNIIPTTSPLNYYPAYAEGILSLFLLPDISWFPNLFNVVVLVPIFFVSIKLAQVFGLSSGYDLIFGTITITFIPVLRLRSTQTIDLWLLLFFLICIYLLERTVTKRNSLFFNFWLGIFTGTKYSAPFIFILVLTVFRQKLLNLWKKCPFSLVLFLIVGGFWYVRNYVLTGNPFYPAPISFGLFRLPGDPLVLSFVGNSPFKEVLLKPNLWYRLISAAVSEFNIWLIVLLSCFLPIIKQKGKLKEYFLLGLSIIGLYYVSPALILNAYADLRYTLPGLSIAVLASMKYLSVNNKTWLNLSIGLHFITVTSMIRFYPKALYLSLILIYIFLILRSFKKPAI